MVKPYILQKNGRNCVHLLVKAISGLTTEAQKELAKSVFDTGTLSEVVKEVLKEVPSDKEIPLPSEMYGVPEKPTTLPWGKSGKRKHDLWLYNIQSDIAVSIEAKTDESFDRKLSQKRAISKKKNSDGGSNMNARLDGILDFIYEGTPQKIRKNYIINYFLQQLVQF